MWLIALLTVFPVAMVGLIVWLIWPRFVESVRRLPSDIVKLRKP